MDNTPLISVIMPAYNAESFIKDSICSVLSQTYENWELLILDDCSTDRTVEIAKVFEESDPRIRLFINAKNVGVAKTRNMGFDLASGEWIALLDSDDIWHSQKLEKQLTLSQQTDAELLYTSYSLFSESAPDKAIYNVPGQISYESMLRENVIGCSTVMLHKTVIDRFRFRYDAYHEDYALWLELLRSGCAAAGCTDVLVDWRISESSRSHDKWQAAKNRWYIYRRIEKLQPLKAAKVFCIYTYRGLRKHKRI